MYFSRFSNSIGDTLINERMHNMLGENRTMKANHAKMEVTKVKSTFKWKNKFIIGSFGVLLGLELCIPIRRLGRRPWIVNSKKWATSKVRILYLERLGLTRHKVGSQTGMRAGCLEPQAHCPLPPKALLSLIQKLLHCTNIKL